MKSHRFLSLLLALSPPLNFYTRQATMASTLFLATLAVLLLPASIAAAFTCKSSPATCSALIEYSSPNATTYAAVSSLFQVPHLSLLAANNFPIYSLPTHPLPPSTPIRIPYPCACANSSGASDHTPFYTVKPNDDLDAIARTIFMQLVTYQEIQAANGLPDPNHIVAGQKLWIPLPCSCDPVGGKRVVHLGHVVALGSTVAGIAAEFGTDEQTLLQLNGIAQPKDLLAGAVLDVPLQACSSSFSNTSLDYNLLVPNGSYALTAKNCVLCSCSSSELDCQAITGLSSSKCPAAKCGNLIIGNTTTSGCDAKACSYAGYTNTTGFSILTNIDTKNTCSNGGGSTKLGLKESRWIVTLSVLHAILMCYWFM